MGLMMEEGYETGVSMSDKALINECESRLSSSIWVGEEEVVKLTTTS